MEYLTIQQAAERLNMKKKRLEQWFDNKHNPLEVVSGVKLNRINGRRMIPEAVLEEYTRFISNHFTCAEAAEFLKWDGSVLQNWIHNHSKGLKVIKIGLTNYIHKEHIIPLQDLRMDTTNCMSTAEIIKELKIHKSTVLEAIRNNHIKNGFRIKGGYYYAPRESVEEYKEKYFKFNHSKDYYSVDKAAEILGYTPRQLRRMVKNPRIELAGEKNGFKKTCYFLKRDVHAYKNFLDTIPHQYYTVNQIVNKFQVSRKFVDILLKTYMENEIKWTLLNAGLERVIQIKEFDACFAAHDKFRIEKTLDPHCIFMNAVSISHTPDHLLETKQLFLDYVSLKQNTSRASKQVQRMYARIYVFLFRILMNLEKEIFTFSDNEIKWFLKTTTNSNIKKHFISFLSFLQDRMTTTFSEKYSIAKKPKGNQNKDIYSLDEFIWTAQYVKNVEHHIFQALMSRSYAATWLYISLHLTNAWRSSDFLKLPTVDISLIKVHTLQWFIDGNRLSLVQAQRIVNQYAHARLKVSKTGALNRFLVNQDMLVPIATMIVICELHRRNEDGQFLLAKGINDYNLIKTNISSFFPNHIQFGSLKMNRSFMTYLFHEATVNTESLGIALDLVQQTRSHKDPSSTTIYIQSTNKDGPLGDTTLHLCNRGHFGYLYNLLIEKANALAKRDLQDTLKERTLKIQEYRRLFTTPYELEKFGAYLQSQAEERESLAVRVALMSREEAEQVINKIFMDQMPGHTEHAQCFSHPNCPHPTAVTCIGCLNMIPKNYLLISIGIELKKRIEILTTTKNTAIASRERSWIHRMLVLLQEATNTFGIEYTKTFMDYDNLLLDIAAAYKNEQSLSENE